MKRVILLILIFGFFELTYSQIGGNPKSILEYTAQIDIKVGDTITNLRGYTIDSSIIDEIYFENRVTILNFSVPGCKPCAYEYRYLNSIYKKYSRSDLNILGIYPIDEATIKEYLKSFPKSSNPLKLTHSLFDSPIFNLVSECMLLSKSQSKRCNHISKLYGFLGYPITIIIDQEQIVRHLQVGFHENKNDAELMKQEWITIIDLILNNN